MVKRKARVYYYRYHHHSDDCDVCNSVDFATDVFLIDMALMCSICLLILLPITGDLELAWNLYMGNIIFVAVLLAFYIGVKMWNSEPAATEADEVIGLALLDNVKEDMGKVK
jgi:hypothetical protein